MDTHKGRTVVRVSSRIWSVVLAVSISGCSCAMDVGNIHHDGGPIDAATPWMLREQCGNGIDDDQNGVIDDGCPCGAGETQPCFHGLRMNRGVGLCVDGVQVCRSAGAEWGDWGNSSCEGAVTPAPEQCDEQDHNCDGARDEGCACNPGQVRECGAQLVLPPCMPGTQTCNSAGLWGGCEGAIGPSADVCDGIDNDCDGLVDPGCDCVPEPERCGDGIDNDCDGRIDEPACTPDWLFPCTPGPPSIPGTPADCTNIPAGWQDISLTDSPSPRMGSSAVWTGHEIIVWGGFETSEQSDLGDGGRLDPRTNQWRAMSAVGAPSPRRFHIAAWTGREMIVWGGAPLVESEGGRIYDPMADSWRPMSAIGAPSARTRPAAIWTGRELIVWGGRGASSDLDDGGIYDPLTDRWRPISMTNAPSARDYPDAVWTGCEMIVWGGSRSSGSEPRGLANGGIYHPATDSWRPLETSGGPRWRSSPVVQWAGAEMVVWGGTHDDGSFPTEGFLFDPVANQWRSMTRVGAPEGRGNAESVFSEDAVIVWGGAFDFRVHPRENVLPKGDLYEIASETWVSIPEVGAPPGRTGHIAIWTGCSLIVWGGVTTDDVQSHVTNTGGIWTPSR